MCQPNIRKNDFCSDLLLFFFEKIKNEKKIIFWFFHKNQNNSLQKPLFLNFRLTHTDVFFDEQWVGCQKPCAPPYLGVRTETFLCTVTLAKGLTII